MLTQLIDVSSPKITFPLTAPVFVPVSVRTLVLKFIFPTVAPVAILVPVIGYDKTAQIAYEAYETGKTIRELLLDKNILSDMEVKKLLNPSKMTQPLK